MNNQTLPIFVSVLAVAVSVMGVVFTGKALKYQAIQQFETTFFNLLKNQREIVNALTDIVFPSPHTTYNETLTGNEVIAHLARELNENFDGSFGHFKTEGATRPH